MYKIHIDAMAEAVAKKLGEHTQLRSDTYAESLVKIKEALKSCWEDKIAVSWTVEDVLQAAENIDKEISDDDANQILGIVLQKFDAGIGINWTVLECSVDTYLSD